MTTNHSKSFPILLMTANVGSIFEDPDNLLKIWVRELLQKLDQVRPLFFALHMQEVGGKTYEDSMKHVEDFVRVLIDSESLSKYKRMAIFLDEDFTEVDKFTALGNVYFIHDSVQNVELFDFKESKFVSVTSQHLYTGNIEEVPFIEKSKFPLEFFPECKWSRKGFIRTRWNLTGNLLDLVNIHLFHDASNLVSVNKSPSVYAFNRERALRYTLDRFEQDSFDKVPLFIFGDFNFRMDTRKLVKKIASDKNRHEELDSKNGQLNQIVYKTNENEVFLAIGKKTFNLTKIDEMFLNNNNIDWLLEHDFESQQLSPRLKEFVKNFPPSYPFVENCQSSSYMLTRCPSWCDRVMFDSKADQLIKSINQENTISYEMLGRTVPMGDHKPIYLQFQLAIQIASPPEVNKEDINTKNLSDASGVTAELQPDSSGKTKVDHCINSCNSMGTTQTSNLAHTSRKHTELRLRTLSIPELGQQNKDDSIHSNVVQAKGSNLPCKRHLSVTQSERSENDSWRRPLIHDEEWYQKTQQLFRAIHNARLTEANRLASTTKETSENSVEGEQLDDSKEEKETVDKWKLSCNRLTSHHSSSDEEWYTEIQQKLALVESAPVDYSDQKKKDQTFEESDKIIMNSNVISEIPEEEIDLSSKQEISKEYVGDAMDLDDDGQLLSNPPPTRANTVGQTDYGRQTVLDAIQQLTIDRKAIASLPIEEEQIDANSKKEKQNEEQRKGQQMNKKSSDELQTIELKWDEEEKKTTDRRFVGQEPQATASSKSTDSSENSKTKRKSSGCPKICVII